MNKELEMHLIWGTGALGMAVMQELISKGKSVTLVNRSGSAIVPKGVKVVKGNAYDLESVCSVCKGASV